MQLALPTTETWLVVPQRDPYAFQMFTRHYTYTHSPIRQRNDFVGPGETLLLRTPNGDALFLWRKEIKNATGEVGVNCAVFRNEGSQRSSDLIRSACDIAWGKWDGTRLYTYVDSRKIQSTNPGYCFLKAGWQRCGKTKGGLDILEMLPEWA